MRKQPGLLVCKFSKLRGILYFFFLSSFMVRAQVRDLALQSVTSGPNGLSLKEAISSTLEKHPDMLLANEKYTEGEANRNRAYSEAFPKISSMISANTRKDEAASPGAFFYGDKYNYYTMNFEISQPLYTSGAVGSGIQMYSKELEMRSKDKEIAERDLRTRTILAYFAVALAQKNLDTMNRLQEISRSLLKTAEARYRIGNEQALSVLQMKTNLLLIAPQVTAAESHLKIKASELVSLIEQPELKVLNIHSNMVAPDWGALLSKVGRPTYKRLEIERNELRIQSLEASKQLQLSVNFPSVYFTGNWGRKGTKKSVLFDGDYSSWNVGLKLTVPIFSGLSSLYDRRAYSSLIAQSRILEKKLIDQATLEQVRAEQELTSALDQVSSSEKALAQAKKSVSVAERSYRLGTATYLQVSDTQQKLANADLSFSQSQYDLIAKMCGYFNAYNYPLQSLIDALNDSSQKPSEPPGRTGAKKKPRAS